MKATGVQIDGLIDQMERALDVLSRREQLTAANVTNVDTPGYHTLDIDFPAALKRAVRGQVASSPLRTTNPKHLSGSATSGSPEAPHRVKGLAQRNDGNDVNIDREMLALAETRGRFEVTTNITRMRIKQLTSAIDDGRMG